MKNLKAIIICACLTFILVLMSLAIEVWKNEKKDNTINIENGIDYVLGSDYEGEPIEQECLDVFAKDILTPQEANKLADCLKCFIECMNSEGFAIGNQNISSLKEILKKDKMLKYRKQLEQDVKLDHKEKKIKKAEDDEVAVQPIEIKPIKKDIIK